MMGYSLRTRGGRVGAGADQQMQIGAVRGLCGAPSLVSLVSTTWGNWRAAAQDTARATLMVVCGACRWGGRNGHQPAHHGAGASTTATSSPPRVRERGEAGRGWGPTR